MAKAIGKTNIAVFASGRGSNFNAILSAIKKGKIKANLALLISDNPQARVLEKARRAKIKTLLVKRGDFSSKNDFERVIIEHLKAAKIGLVVLAGYMCILGPEILRAYKNRIINIHPALLPAFKGAHGIRDAFRYGVKISGVTVHFVNEEMDAGPIIAQEALKINEGDSLGSVAARIHKIEHKLYPKAIQRLLARRLRLSGRKVFLKGDLT